MYSRCWRASRMPSIPTTSGTSLGTPAIRTWLLTSGKALRPATLRSSRRPRFWTMARTSIGESATSSSSFAISFRASRERISGTIRRRIAQASRRKATIKTRRERRTLLQRIRRRSQRADERGARFQMRTALTCGKSGKRSRMRRRALARRNKLKPRSDGFITVENTLRLRRGRGSLFRLSLTPGRFPGRRLYRASRRHV
jgi:hypothetical protein